MNRYLFKISDPSVLDKLKELGKVYLASKLIGVYAIETDKEQEEIESMEGVIDLRSPAIGTFNEII